jgi:sialidase-1
MNLRPELEIVKHLMIYEDSNYYSAFPNAIRCPDGEILLVFRRAVNRAKEIPGYYTHLDPTSHVVLSRSHDGGMTWTEPQVIVDGKEHGEQDPTIFQLSDGTLLCAFFRWKFFPTEDAPHNTQMRSVKPLGLASSLDGVWVMKSSDKGHTWSDPRKISIPEFPGELAIQASLQELQNGTCLMPLYGKKKEDETSRAILIESPDGGKTWNYLSDIAYDEDNITSFFEPFLYVTEDESQFVALLRTSDLHLYTTRSRDEGRTWEPHKKHTVWGHPFHALRLTSGRVLITYGYRREPFGIRAKIVDPDLQNIDSAPEFILRDDGGNRDIGYPTATLLDHDRVLVMYYFNTANGTRHIAGTILRSP